MNTKISNTKISSIVFILSFLAFGIRAEDIYVAVGDPNAGDTAVAGRGGENLPYKTLQKAMEHATLEAGDTVWVKEGVYDQGGITFSNSTTTINRVVVKPGVKLRSVSGAAKTVIKGASGTRCVYLCDRSEVRGFTVADGAPTASSTDANGNGAGFYREAGNSQYNAVFSDDEPAVLDCIITNCTTGARGGGNLGKTLFIRCCFAGCKAALGNLSSGGAAQFYNCLFRNTSSITTAIYQGGTLVNCTFVGDGKAVRNPGTDTAYWNSLFVQSLGVFDDFNGNWRKFYNCHGAGPGATLPSADYCGDDACSFIDTTFEGDVAPEVVFPIFGNGAAMRETSGYGACKDYAAYQALFPEKYRSEADKDLYGNPRVTPGESVFDAGCVEVDETRWYVDSNGGSDIYGGDDIGTAAHPYKTLQAAMENARLKAGQVVVAAKGVYNKGGVGLPAGVRSGAAYDADSSVTNRVLVPNDISLVSADGPAETIIEGAASESGSEGLGVGAVRCVQLGERSVLKGFTLRKGYSKDSGTWYIYGGSGVQGVDGGSWKTPRSFVSDCVIYDCYAVRGAALQTVFANRCRIYDCRANTGQCIVDSSTLVNSVCGAQRGGYSQAAYCQMIRNCTFASNVGCTRALHYASTSGKANRCRNSVICADVEDAANYTHCAFALERTTLLSEANLGVGSIRKSLSELALDDDGRPGKGSVLKDAGANELYGAYGGHRDVDGVPRALNKNIDIGACEYDWRNEFKDALCAKSCFVVEDCNSNVVLNATGGVKIDGPGFLSVAWTNRTGSAQYQFASSATGGTLTYALNEGEQQTALDGVTTFESDASRVGLDFSFTGSGSAVLSAFRRLTGLALIFR